MTEKELLVRIEALERRLTAMERRVAKEDDLIPDWVWGEMFSRMMRRSSLGVDEYGRRESDYCPGGTCATDSSPVTVSSGVCIPRLSDWRG